MDFKIKMGIPEMKQLWDDLVRKNKSGEATKDEQQLYKKWGSAMKKLSANPMYPSLKSHEIEELSKRYGIRVWQSYLENKKSKAKRMYWVYGPDKEDITIIILKLSRSKMLPKLLPQ